MEIDSIDYTIRGMGHQSDQTGKLSAQPNLKQTPRSTPSKRSIIFGSLSKEQGKTNYSEKSDEIISQLAMAWNLKLKSIE